MNIKSLHRVLTLFIIAALVCSTSMGQTITAQKINFTTFTVLANHNKILIDWATDNAYPINYFEIQKSADGKNFKTIALVLGPDPKQKSGDHYGCFDKFVPEEVNQSFYRIKHIDINGIEQVSDTKVVAKL